MRNLLLAILFIPNLAIASGIPVVDVANLAEAITQVYHLYQSNVNEVKQIANQIQMIEYDKKTKAAEKAVSW